MRRLARLTLVIGLILLASPAQGLIPAVTLLPASGPAGSTVGVTVTGFTADSTFEIHSGDFDGALLGSGTTNTAGDAIVTVTVPGGTSPGPLTIAVCETQFVACTDTGNEFWVGATATFTVTAPATTTTTSTTAATDTTGTTAAFAPAACSIPAGATVIDFDDWDPSLGFSGNPFGEFQSAFLDAGYYLWFNQWAEYRLSADPPTDDAPGYLSPRLHDSLATITNDPSLGLTTSSPPMVMRLFDANHWTYISGTWDAFVPDYFGFNVGFGQWNEEDFATPEYVVVDLRVTAMPMMLPDGSVLDQGAWESVRVTLGPGAQPVTTCIEIRNTLGELHPYTAFWIDIAALTVDGDPIRLPLDIDDFYYGTVEPPPIIFDLSPEDIPVIDTVPVTVPLPVPAAAEDPAGVPWWWLGIALIGGGVLGALLTRLRGGRSA